MRTSWSVSQLVAEARTLVEESLGTVWVEGEISNFRPSSAGHLYFTLKDDSAQLSMVLFRRQALLLRFRPEDGLAVRVRGALSIYEQRGQLQMVAETMEPVGMGSLQLAFEQLRERLRAEGLFDAARKRALPLFPRRVAVVTSPTGAVIRDFLQIVQRRHAGLEVLVVPVAVQGEGAAAEIETALQRLGQRPELADVIVLARGGGSLEDLAAFNSERVARAIAACPVPVVSAIGHETDFTIADFVADLRAPTPSAAAELVTTSLENVGERLHELQRRLERAARFQMLQARQHFAQLREDRLQQRMQHLLREGALQLDDLALRQESAMERRLRRLREGLESQDKRLHRQDPHRQLAMARIRLTGLQERLLAAGARRPAEASRRLEQGWTALHQAMIGLLQGKRELCERLEMKLAALSPLAVLERGYALVQTESGRIVRDAAELQAGDRIHTRLGQGSFLGRVESVDAGARPTGDKRQEKAKLQRKP